MFPPRPESGGAASPQRRGVRSCGRAEEAGGPGRGLGGWGPSGRYRETERPPGAGHSTGLVSSGPVGLGDEGGTCLQKVGGGAAERAGTPFPSPANRRWPGLGFGAWLLPWVTAQTEVTFLVPVRLSSWPRPWPRPRLSQAPPPALPAPPLALLFPPPARSWNPKPENVRVVGALRSPQGHSQWLSGHGF